MTLSHRWGSQVYKKLVSSTLVDLQRGIDVSSLPHVFQDAIFVAVSLGIKFLWIDSLCIMQDEDDRADWEIESQQMDKVYSHSFLNISATKSSNGSESLFYTSSQGCQPFFDIDLIVDGVSKRYVAIDCDVWADEIDKAPLNGRGWVFQERFLARRILHFGASQMGWECGELRALEMFPRGVPQATSLPFIQRGALYESSVALLGRSESSTDEAFIDTWQCMVTEYSRCRFSFEKDKLRAFVGIAKRITKNNADRYAAGMLESTILYDLPWSRGEEVREASPMTGTLQTPSWSWASVTGEVTFPSILGGIRERFAAIRDFPDPPLAGGKHGDADAGRIRIEGVCLPLHLNWEGEEISNIEMAGFNFPVTGHIWDASIELEHPQQTLQSLSQQGRVLFMPLYRTSYFLNAIVLRKVRGVGTHLRLGAAQIQVMVRGAPPESREWVSVPAVSRAELGDYQWNNRAMDFILYIRKCHSRVVDIV